MLTQVTSQATPSSTPRGHYTPSNSSSKSTSIDPVKTRSLCEIYEVDTPNSLSLFSLFSQIDYPLTFEEVVKQEVWEQAMDEEIECI